MNEECLHAGLRFSENAMSIRCLDCPAVWWPMGDLYSAQAVSSLANYGLRSAVLEPSLIDGVLTQAIKGRFYKNDDNDPVPAVFEEAAD